MRIEEYLDSYSNYRNGYQAMLNTVKLIEKHNDKNDCAYVSTEGVKKELYHRERVLRYATARMQAAIARIGDTRLSNYIMCKYFYGLKNAAIAVTFNYSERQIYRLSAEAKARLYRELLKLMPKPRRGEVGRCYRYAREKTFLKLRAV